MWRSLVARFVRDEEVAGSNPVIPTVKIFKLIKIAGNLNISFTRTQKSTFKK